MKSMMVQSKGFTLVELIVVITILAILATVGFLSLQGYTDDARNTKIAANLRTVASSLVNDQAVTGNAFSSYVNATNAATYALTTTAGTGNVYGVAFAFDPAKTYTGGQVNAAALRIDATKFFDAASGSTTPTPFAMGALQLTENVAGKLRVRPLFQIAGVTKDSAGQKAIIEGNYSVSATSDVQGLIKASVKSDGTAAATQAGVVGNAAGGIVANPAVVINGRTDTLPYRLP